MKDKIIDKTIYPIGKDTDGVLCTTEELHKIILELVLEFDRICRKHDIPYALAFGSALGCYNYGGFIPWDDDADLVVKYEDINRIVEAFKEDLNDKYVLECYENNKKYNVLIPTMKLRLKDSYIQEASELTLPPRCGSHGFFIDVGAFMGVPEDRKEHEKLIKKSKRMMPWYCFVDGFLRIHPYGMKRRLKAFEAKVAEQYKDSNYVSQTVIIPFQNWSNTVVNLSWPKKVIYPFKEYEFEGHMLYSFNNIKEFARIRYGERSLRKWDGEKWVDPFPESRRHAGHAKKFNLHHKVK